MFLVPCRFLGMLLPRVMKLRCQHRSTGGMSDVFSSIPAGRAVVQERVNPEDLCWQECLPSFAG